MFYSRNEALFAAAPPGMNELNFEIDPAFKIIIN